MVERERELNALREGYEVSIRQLRTLMEAQARLRAVAEETAQDYREQFERVMEALCPDVVDDLRLEDPAGMSQMTPKALADALIRSAKRRLSRLGAAEVSGRDLEELYEEAATQATTLRERSARQEQDLADALERAERAETRVGVLEQSLEDMRRRLDGREASSQPRALPPAGEGDSISPDRLPGWVQEWQKTRTYERDKMLLKILAEIGVARRSDAAGLFGEQADVDPHSGSVVRLFTRCNERLKLIELVKATVKTGGPSVQHLIRLTDKGRDACRLILGVEPVPSQATELLDRHKSPEHALLNLEAADTLREAGYEVDVFPGAIDLPGNRLYVPDLAVSRHGRSMFVEVERATYKDAARRNRKWENYYSATGGRFYIVVANQKALNEIKSEILFWAGRRDLVLWMMSISDSRGARGDDVWTYKRGKG